VTCPRRSLLALVVLSGFAVAVPAPAQAACHAFTISAAPTTVAEGGTVTVTVGRDAGVNPSSVEVVSVNETAVAGQDYTAVQRRVSMSTETSQTFTVATTNDSTPEPAETFKLHLQNAGGCAVNPNFGYGPDARVTIQDNDPPATAPGTAPGTAPATAGATTRPTTVTSVGDTSTTLAAETSTMVTETTEASTTTADLALAGDGDDDGGGAGAAVATLIGAILIVLGGIGYVLYRRRPAPGA